MSENNHSGLHLDELQRLQLEFDKSHGFDFSKTADPSFSVTSFAALALCGEVGELANQIKKAQRASWLMQEPSEHLSRAKAEIGGILAYLLKLSTCLGTNLDEAYLSTMSDNWLRFPVQVRQEERRFVFVAGPSGSGKSSVIEKLKENGRSAYIEKIPHNSFVDGLYDKSLRYDPFEVQTWFLDQIESFSRSSLESKTLIVDQDPAAVVRVYGHLLKQDGRISDNQYVLLLKHLLKIEQAMADHGGRRMTIFLDTEEPELLRRMQSRGDETLPTEIWLQRSRSAFLDLQQKTPGSHVISTRGKTAESIAQEVAQLIRQP